MGLEVITKYFADFTDEQMEQFAKMENLYKDWNSKINVISRKDIDNLYTRHVLHSLSIAAFTTFTNGSRILDLGTGGGFPGIPMAIFYPDVDFHLIDGTRKKIMVVQEVADALGLQNVYARQARAEETKDKYDFVLSRAVAPLDQLVEWSRPLVSKKERNAVPNGLITLKGGAVDKEIKSLPKGTYTEKESINQYFNEEEFDEKFLIYVPLS
ncbi:16S rRNA (guanine(527)-N(7))-methyltransferase RsmG [Membranicola marinus]|uniref:Ribosomal RNA small subunit methyltransferase G n=1 Tax=Membranihabitans marinus TaxID=1227546 RepID=A0A953HQV6_9BACT|nr:16S rRNA (guanine(527)-N(7))-methyltransferase RsmG [Membranihabitans marinus]MBY5956720.1 16S rRNA (guanine(527)-N(7))-methyltransferase RsmG [Membranihabitans marinus]